MSTVPAPTPPGPQLPDFLAGYKTYIAAGLAALAALNGVLHFMSPDLQQTIMAAAAALGLYGIRQAIARNQ